VPFVALGWALCLSGDHLSTWNGAALFLAVWGIYLGDRILDASRLGSSEDLAPRHEWARRHRRLLGVLALIVLLTFVLLILPRLSPGTVWAGSGAAMATAFYFLVFRFSGNRLEWLARFPAKEVAIGLTFAAGIGIAATGGEPDLAPLAPLAGMVLLFTGNCLLIGRAEQGWDREADFASYYTRPGQLHRLPETLLVAASVIGAVESIREPGLCPLALLIGSGATLILARTSSRQDFQAIADGLLLVPWAVLWVSR